MPLRERAYRDPVHGFITVVDPLLQALIDTPEFQRLRRIRQLGATAGTYHGAEHSRFGHSLGSLWIMDKILERLRSRGLSLDPFTATVARAAALLHDVGHGPFSHALEGVITPGAGHEVWSARIVRGDSAVAAILRGHDPSLADAVAAVIEGRHPAREVVTLVSSQLDVDRMDYLLRDSLYTGVTYGRFDLERLINTLLVVDGDVVLLGKGIVAAEEYVLARYHMYWQVYLHKTIRGQEVILRRI
ncbi:MAG TPA: HD domain-containing protein, partial [Limnochordia bacterium]